MAARLTKRQQDMVKEHIKTTQILKRLQNHIDGEIELKPTQVAAAKILLGKTMADLRATEHSAGDGASVGVQFVIKQ